MAKKCVYKVSSQGKAWELIYILESLFCVFYFSSEFLENNFLKEKGELIHTCYTSYGNPTLGGLSYLHVGTSLGWSKLKPGMVLGHGLVERGSSQVIHPSNTEVISSYELLILVNWVSRFQPLKELQFLGMRFWTAYFIF